MKKYLQVKKIILSLLLFFFLIFTTGCGVLENTENFRNVQVHKGVMNGYDAREVFSKIKIGWVLGNTLDVHYGDETSWHNPRTTVQMIKKVKDKGFDIVKIPVTWANHVSKAPEYTVDPKFMDRVNEVLDYVIQNDMYVIIDMHNDPSFWYIPDSNHLKEVEEQYTAIWTQIAERFKDYGEKVIFEAVNEPRVTGTEYEWTEGTEDSRKCLNHLNRKFVETIRKTGGNNSKRILLIPSYAQKVTKETISELDIINDKYLGVSVHIYNPIDFIPSYKENIPYTDVDKSRIIENFDIIKKYLISKNIPVIITEFGIQIRTYTDGKTNIEYSEQWEKDFLKMAKENNIPSLVWDNNSFDKLDDGYGLLDRKKLIWRNENIVDNMINAYK